ncbi:MAG: hypothetical protein WA948_12265 [Pontixanthobacter sp.]
MSEESSGRTAWDYWDRSRLGSLHRRAKSGETILAGEVSLIVEANPELVPDDVLREYVICGLKGELKGKRGRKRTSARMAREQYIAAAYDHRLAWLQDRASKRKERGNRRMRGDYSPSDIAYILTGRQFYIAPESVRNLVSSLNNRS